MDDTQRFRGAIAYFGSSNPILQFRGYLTTAPDDEMGDAQRWLLSPDGRSINGGSRSVDPIHQILALTLGRQTRLIDELVQRGRHLLSAHDPGADAFIRHFKAESLHRPEPEFLMACSHWQQGRWTAAIGSYFRFLLSRFEIWRILACLRKGEVRSAGRLLWYALRER
jgi:hypothetical protein